MNEVDTLLTDLQSGIADLYLHVKSAEEISCTEKASYQKQILINVTWLKVEKAISDLESITTKIIKLRNNHQCFKS